MRYVQSQRNFSQKRPRSRSRIVTQKAEWSLGHYSNPYAKTKRRSFRFPFKTVSISILFIGWFGLMLYLPFFQVTQVSFQGLKIIKQDEIESYVRQHYLTTNKWWPKSNYFLVGQGSMEKDLTNTYSLNSVTVNKVFPNKLEITLEEKVSSIIYDNGEGYYLLDQSGSVLKNLMLSDVKITPTTTLATSTISANINQATNISTSTPTTTPYVPNLAALKTDYDGYPVVYDSRRPPVVDKQKDVLQGSVIQGILDIYNALKRNKLSEVKFMTIDDPNAGVTITQSDKPWTILMNPLADVSTQLENIRIITKDNKPKEYIDVRFGDRVYWK